MSRLLALAFVVLPTVSLPAQHPDPFDYDRSLPLEVTDSLVEVIDGIEVRAVSFRSPAGGRAPGRLYLPGVPGRRPAVLLGHGAPGGPEGYNTVTLSLALARSGAVVFALASPFNRREGGPIEFTPRDSAEQVQHMVDWRRAIDWLETRPDVDPGRLGYVGNSYGGAQGALLVGIEPRLRAAVLRVVDGGFVAHFTDPCDETRTGAASIEGCLNWEIPEEDLSVVDRERWARAMLPVEPIRFIGVSRAALLLQNARQDEAVSPARARRLHAASPEGTVVQWYDSGHRLPPAALLDGLRFLAGHLGLAAPDAEFEAWLATRTAPAR